MNGNGDLTSQDVRPTERLTRVANDTIQYEATVDDAKPWVPRGRSRCG